MRIIAGDYKGRRLQSPQDYSIRPTTDKVKEALFSILTEKIWGSRVLDLFAGTGNLGIEALSPGRGDMRLCRQLQRKPETDQRKHRSLQSGRRGARGSGRLPKDPGKSDRTF